MIESEINESVTPRNDKFIWSNWLLNNNGIKLKIEMKKFAKRMVFILFEKSDNITDKRLLTIRIPQL